MTPQQVRHEQIAGGCTYQSTSECCQTFLLNLSILLLAFVLVSCTFSCTLKYLVRDCDPNTGEPDDDGYDDEYVVCEI